MRCLAVLLICLFACSLAAQPEIDVLRGGVSIADGANDTVANPGTSPFNLSYTINNDGATDLNLTSMPEVVISGEVNCTVSLLVAPATPVAAAGTTTFTLQVSPLSATDFSFDLAIANNDSDEDPYDIHFSAKPVTPPAKSTSSSKKSDNCSSDDDAGNGAWFALAALAMLVVSVRSRSASSAAARARAR